MAIGLILSLAASAAGAEAPGSELTARRFVAAVTRGADPVAAGLVPSLTQDQQEGLKALRSCEFSLLGTSTRKRTRILWQCGRRDRAKAWMTQLNFDGDIVRSVEIVPVVKRPAVD